MSYVYIEDSIQKMVIVSALFMAMAGVTFLTDLCIANEEKWTAFFIITLTRGIFLCVIVILSFNYFDKSAVGVNET